MLTDIAPIITILRFRHLSLYNKFLPHIFTAFSHCVALWLRLSESRCGSE